MDTAFFSFSCALPEAESELSTSQQNANNTNDNDSGSSASVGAPGSSSAGSNERDGDDGSEAKRGEEVGEEEELTVDGGWEIQEGGECAYFYLLDGHGNYSVVGQQFSQQQQVQGQGVSSSESGSLLLSSNTLLLSGLEDGEHELRWVLLYYCYYH